jgi:hypothetical protein
MLLPLGVSDAVVTGTAAVAGALVGATAGGIVDARLDLRRERRAAQAGARLIAADLSMADAMFKVAEKEGRWWMFFDPKIGASWDRYRQELALNLDGNDFEAVAEAVFVVVEVSDKIPASPVAARQTEAHEGYVDLSEDSVSGFGPVRSNLAEGYNALSRLAGHEPVEGTIHGRVTDPAA